MAKTLNNWIDMAEHAIGTSTDARIDPQAVVNEAGRHLVAMHTWSFLDRPPQGLDFVAGQGYVDLPSDFDQLLWVEADSRLESTAHLTTLSNVQRLRASALVDPFRYHLALSWPTQSDTTSAPNPRIEIWPTPGSSETDALSMGYRAGWLELTSGDSVANIPIDLEPLLGQLVRAFALGYADEMNGRGSVVQRLEPIEESTMVYRLKEKDGLNQGSLGQMTGGITQSSYDLTYRPHRTIQAGNTT